MNKLKRNFTDEQIRVMEEILYNIAFKSTIEKDDNNTVSLNVDINKNNFTFLVDWIKGL